MKKDVGGKLWAVMPMIFRLRKHYEDLMFNHFHNNNTELMSKLS
jgi:hypothetical protein